MLMGQQRDTKRLISIACPLLDVYIIPHAYARREQPATPGYTATPSYAINLCQITFRIQGSVIHPQLTTALQRYALAALHPGLLRVLSARKLLSDPRPWWISPCVIIECRCEMAALGRSSSLFDSEGLWNSDVFFADVLQSLPPIICWKNLDVMSRCLFGVSSAPPTTKWTRKWKH